MSKKREKKNQKLIIDFYDDEVLKGRKMIKKHKYKLVFGNKHN